MGTKDFSGFIRHKDLQAAPGFRTQVSSLSGGCEGLLKGQIFKLEDYPSWASALSLKLGVDFKLPHMNKSDLRLMDRENVLQSDRTYIETIFREDYEAFEY
jgi:hypothetical protein